MTTNHLQGAHGINYWKGRHSERQGEGTSLRVVEDAEGDPELPALKDAIATELYNVACNLIHQAHTMRAGSEPAPETADLAKKWFGTAVDQAKVTEKVEKIVTFLKGHALQVRFHRGGQYLGAYDLHFHVEKVVQLGKPFLYKRFSWGEKVMTLLHEMSHVILSTRDLGTDLEGKALGPFKKLGAAYGPYARMIATDNGFGSIAPKDAINNAENWGYFLVSHHTFITQNVADWLGTTGGREFSRLDAKTLTDYDKYVAGRVEAPGPRDNAGDFGAHYTKDQVPLYDLSMTQAPTQFTEAGRQVLQQDGQHCDTCGQSFIKRMFPNHNCRCPHCKEFFPRTEMDHHLTECSQKK